MLTDQQFQKRKSTRQKDQLKYLSTWITIYETTMKSHEFPKKKKNEYDTNSYFRRHKKKCPGELYWVHPDVFGERPFMEGNESNKSVLREADTHTHIPPKKT